MESRSHVWSDFSFVVSSGYRERVLSSLAPKPKVPRQLAEETDLRIVHVSRALRELSGRGLVECLTPDVKARGRLYGLTPDGAALLSELNGSRRYVTPTLREPAKEGFVPKIRGSSVVRFLEYLRKTRGRGVVSEAIASWSVDADKLTEDTWLSVEACAQLLEIVETKFGDGSYGYIRKLFSGAMSTFPTVLEQLSKAIRPTMRDYEPLLKRMAELSGRAITSAHEALDDPDSFYPFVGFMMPVVMLTEPDGSGDDLLHAYLRALAPAIRDACRATMPAWATTPRGTRSGRPYSARIASSLLCP